MARVEKFITLENVILGQLKIGERLATCEGLPTPKQSKSYRSMKQSSTRCPCSCPQVPAPLPPFLYMACTAH